MSDQDLKSYLETQIAEGKKSVIASTVLFVLVAILTVSYFQWFKAEVEPFLEPDELAEFTVSEARRNLPALALIRQPSLKTHKWAHLSSNFQKGRKQACTTKYES